KTAGNIIKVTWSARWEIDSWNYYTSEMIWFRILRGGTTIATTSVYTSGGVAAGGNYYFTDGNVSLSVYDTGAPTGSSTWKVQYWMTNQWGSNTERVRIGERYMIVTELEP
ncbi:MAG: hypothetical protein JKX73_09515, partial [Flavobacteriales bacterium]|nr:hypothetical protein [Flavobacteriales bacterium]